MRASISVCASSSWRARLALCSCARASAAADPPRSPAPLALSSATCASKSAMRPCRCACETAAEEADPARTARSASRPSSLEASALFSFRMPEHWICSAWNLSTSDALSCSVASSFCEIITKKGGTQEPRQLEKTGAEGAGRWPAVASGP
eukprot:scaffold5382_cov114-Isochrysis_galbana.AAC.16